MLYTEFGAGGLKSSVLGFGCAPLMGRAGKRDSLRALATAYEYGITFYDTARSYGYGECEALLGEFLRGKRDRVLVSTKFGIVPAKQNLLKRIAKPVIRGALRAVPSARKLVQKGIRGEFQEAFNKWPAWMEPDVGKLYDKIDELQQRAVAQVKEATK